MTKQKQSSDTDTDTHTDAQRTSRRRVGVTTVITLTLVVGVVLAASISPLGVVAAATEFSVTTTAPETVSPNETIDITYTIENTGDTDLESLALTGTPQTSDTELTITDAASDSAATITDDNRIIFETVAPGASVTATLTVAVGTDATGTESLTAETTNGFGQNEVSKQTVTELPVTTETETLTPPNFEVSDLEPQDATVNVNDAFDVSATIENTGDLQGEQEIELRVGGDAVRTQTVSLDTGVTTTVTFENVTVGTAGEFTQTVASANDSVTGSLTIEEAAEDDFSVTTAAPETVSPDETIDITYTIENTGDTTLESLALSGTPQTSDTVLTITDATSDDAATIPADNRVIFETVEPAASVTATLTVVVGSDATGTESLTAETTNGFGQNEVSKQTVTELTVTTENTPPSADAGTNQTVNEESQVALDGTGSSDPDGDSDSGPPAPPGVPAPPAPPGFGDSLSYRWTQTSGPSVSLQDSATPTPEFTAPSVTSDTTLTFELTVTDGNGGQDTDTVAIVVEPQQGQIDVTRQVSASEVAPGEEVTITTEIEMTGVSGGVSITSSYEPPVSEATIQSVTVGGTSGDPLISSASVTGSTVTLSSGDVESDVTVTVTESLTVGEQTDITHEISGEVTAGETTTEIDPLEVTVAEQSVVDEYDTDNDGTISITELGVAGADFARGELTITELGRLGAEFAS